MFSLYCFAFGCCWDWCHSASLNTYEGINGLEACPYKAHYTYIWLRDNTHWAQFACTDLRTLKAILYNYIIMHYTVTIEGKAENAFTPDNMLFHRFMKVMSITALRDTFLHITTVLVVTVATWSTHCTTRSTSKVTKTVPQFCSKLARLSPAPQTSDS